MKPILQPSATGLAAHLRPARVAGWLQSSDVARACALLRFC